MDYSTYLTGTTKLELDTLDKLEGKFKIQDSNSKLTVEGSYNGKKLSSDDWDFLKSCHLPKFLVKVVECTQELSVVESKSGPRNWVMSDIGWKKKILTCKGEVYFSSHAGLDRWDYCDDFIEDGKVVSVTKIWKMDNGKMIQVLDMHDSVTTDKGGNIIWTLVWNAPHRGVKITKVWRALRVHLVPKRLTLEEFPEDSENCLVRVSNLEKDLEALRV